MSALRSRTGELLAFFAALGFSFKAIFVKFALAAGLDPIAFLSMRMMLAGPLFLLILLAQRDRRWPNLADTARIVAMGLLGFYVAAMLDFLGLRWLSAGLERIVLYTHPTFVLLLGAWWTGVSPGPRAWAAVGVAWTGLVVAAGADAVTMPLPDLLRGTSLVAGCAALYAGYLLGVEELGHRYGTFRVAAMANLVASIALGAHGGLLLRDELARASTYTWGLAAIMATASTVLPAILLTAAIARIGPGRASTFGMIGPVAASLLGWALLGEPLSIFQLLGGALVVAGVSLAATGRARSPAATDLAGPGGDLAEPAAQR